MSEEVKQEGDFKIKSKPKMKKLNKDTEAIKVDLSTKGKVDEDVIKVDLNQDNANKEQETTTVVADKPAETVQEVDTEVSSGESAIQDGGFSGIEEVTEEEVEQVSKEVKEAIRDERVSGKPLPENVEKLVAFMRKQVGTLRTILD